MGSWHSTKMPSCYRPQRICGKVMFSQASVILSTGGGVSSRHPPRADTPPIQTPWTDTTWADNAPPRADTSLGRQPPGRHLSGQTPHTGQTDTPPPGQTPLGRHPLPVNGCCGGRYASYGNTFLLYHFIVFDCSNATEDNPINCFWFCVFCSWTGGDLHPPEPRGRWGPSTADLRVSGSTYLTVKSASNFWVKLMKILRFFGYISKYVSKF